MKFFTLFFVILNLVLYLNAQDTEATKAIFKSYKAGYYENVILKDTSNTDKVSTSSEPKKYFKTDFSGKSFPNDKKLYNEIWHTQPVCQGNSGTCWCYSPTSLMESEAKRVSGIEIKLSEMYTVYWEYYERALDYVKTHGNTTFSEGSEAASIPRIWKKYGIVPYSAYEGKPVSRKYNHHREMEKQMEEFLKKVKENAQWNEEFVGKQIRAILNKELGLPPDKFSYNGKDYSPFSFLSDFLKLKMEDYYSFMSTSSFPFNEKHELVEDDNWWHCSNYYNVNADDFMTVIKSSLKNGYTVCICGDISEPGYGYDPKVAVVPSFDISAESINDDARQMRLSNGTTSDDHCIHMVGLYEKDGKSWFLVKDSNGGAFDGDFPGYRFFSEDYVKLKMMNIMIYKEAGRVVLDKIIK
jgi:bleomycin hydrolase